MRWAQRHKRVFRIDIGQCERCGGKVKVIATVEDAVVVGILAHLQEREQQARGAPANAGAAHRPRGPPGQGEFDLVRQWRTGGPAGDSLDREQRDHR
jgi:hypothetical protein